MKFNWLHIITLAMVALCAPMVAFAGSDTITYEDEFITFEYPEDWVDCGCPPEGNEVIIGNTDNSIDFEESLEEGDVQIVIVKSTGRFFEEAYDAEWDYDLDPDEALETYFVEPQEGGDVEFSDIESLDLEDRDSAYVYLSNEDAEFESMIFVIELSNGEVSMILVNAVLGELESFEREVFAIAESLDSVEDSGNDDDDNTEIELSEEFESDDETISFAFPEDWLADGGEGFGFVASDDEAFEIESLDELEEGQVVVLIYTSVEMLDDYPEDTEFAPTTVVSFYAASAMASGFELYDAMDAFTLDDRDASSVSYAADGVDVFIAAVEGEDDDSIVMFAYSLEGEIEDSVDALIAILATVEGE